MHQVLKMDFSNRLRSGALFGRHGDRVAGSGRRRLAFSDDCRSSPARCRIDGIRVASASPARAMSKGKFSVHLDNAAAAYLPGQIVNGRVLLHLDTAETVRGISVECVGKCEVQWSESESVGRDTRTVYYQASENYFQQSILLFGSSAESRELGRGEYEYHFSFVLPQRLPTSFEGEFGFVRYYVRAKVDRPWKFDYEFKRGFSVNAIVDLNRIDQAASPVQKEDSKTVCCFCCQSGPITARCWLPKSGYVPGERILFCGQVDNHSRMNLVATRVKLVERSKFKAQGKQKESERVIGEIIRRQSSDVESDVWDHVPIALPALAPSRLENCSLIDISYVLEFIVDPGAFSFNLTVPLEILIGTVPLQESFPTFPQANDFQPSAPVADFGPSPAPGYPPVGGGGFAPPFRLDEYPDLPPLTYQSSMFGGNLKETGDSEYLNIGFDTLFTPQYINYGKPEPTLTIIKN